jgi:hypothetical protein
MRVSTILMLCAAGLLLAACMTPQQVEAAAVIQELYRDGILSREQFNALMAALNPSTWVSDVIAIGSGLLGGTGAFVATNVSRNRARRQRGEPVTVPAPPA